MLPNRDTPAPFDLLREDLWVADAVYQPLWTPLLLAAKEKGAQGEVALGVWETQASSLLVTKCKSLQGGLLHGDGLPAAVAPDEDPQVPDPPIERHSAEGPGVVGDTGEECDLPVETHIQAVVFHRDQLQLTTRDVADVVSLGTELAEARDLDELVSHEPGKGGGVRPLECLPACELSGAHGILRRRGSRVFLGRQPRKGAAEEQQDRR